MGRILAGDFTITMDGDKVTATPPNPANAASGTICGDKVRLTRTGTENGVGFEVVSDLVYTLTTFTVTATRTFADGTVVKFSGGGTKKP